MLYITICEYDCLTSIDNGGLVPAGCYEWLKQFALGRPETNEKELIRLVSTRGKERLQVQNYVGVLQTPFGTCIEILPKTSAINADHQKSLHILLKMLRVVYELPALEAAEARLNTKTGQLLEILISEFLKEVLHLLHRGIRSDYIRRRGQKQYLKGRLRVAQQIRLPATEQHHFCVEYDEFLPDRPENCLIRAALNTVLRWSRSSSNQRLARELIFSFIEINPSTKYKSDLSRWSNQRDMIHYRPLKSWVQLILIFQTPWIINGRWEGGSLLFPMEELFERYLGKILKKRLGYGYELREQARSQFLTRHNHQKWFQLRPDFLISQKLKPVAILDAKWKLLDSAANDNVRKYNLSQSDFYQLFAYGQKYLAGSGVMVLIFPAYKKFNQYLPVFEFGQDLKLWVVPFDLEDDVLMLPAEADFFWRNNC